MIRVKFIGHWADDEHVFNQFKNFTKDSNFCWNSIQLVGPEQEYDFLCIVNHPREAVFCDTQKAIVFQWEPIDARKHWGEFFHPDPKRFFAVYDTSYSHNIPCWQISKNVNWLMNNRIHKSKLISGIVSDKTTSPYGDERPGRNNRLDFIQNFLDAEIPEYDHFGMIYQRNSVFHRLRNYRGMLQDKEDGLFPYKYSFTAENGCEINYFTEKFLDAILSECLPLYAGCPNISDFFDPRCYIPINLENPDESLVIVQNAIHNKEWEKRLPIIRKEKHRILTSFSIFPLLESLFFERGLLPE